MGVIPLLHTSYKKGVCSTYEMLSNSSFEYIIKSWHSRSLQDTTANYEHENITKMKCPSVGMHTISSAWITTIKIQTPDKKM